LFLIIDFTQRALHAEKAALQISFPPLLTTIANSFDVSIVSEHAACADSNLHMGKQKLNTDTVFIEHEVNNACDYRIVVDLLDARDRLIYTNRLPASNGLSIKQENLEMEND